MELCTRTFTSFLLFNPSFSPNSVFLRANPNATTPLKFNSLKLSSFSPHVHLFQPFLSPHISSPFTLSAAASASSSSVAVGTEQDRLPAELKVTETEEPNSRVCSFFFLIHFPQFYVASFKVVCRFLIAHFPKNFTLLFFLKKYYIFGFIWILVSVWFNSTIIICNLLYNL